MFDSILNPTTLAWLARRVLEIGGGMLVTHGYVTEEHLPAIIGSTAFLGGIAWNIYSTFVSRKAAVSVQNTAR